MGLWRALFGPRRKEVWQRFCAEIGGQYIEGSFWKSDKVQVQHGPWIITVDTFSNSSGDNSVTYTRLRAPYVNPDGFRFTVYRKNIFSNLGRLIGMTDVEVGFPEFDEAFVIKGNDTAKLRALFANPRIRQLIEIQPRIRFTVKDDEGWFGAHFGENVDELYFHAVGVIKDVDRLKSLYYLFAETLDHLCRIGSAYEGDPTQQT